MKLKDILHLVIAMILIMLVSPFLRDDEYDGEYPNE